VTETLDTDRRHIYHHTMTDTLPDPTTDPAFIDRDTRITPIPLSGAGISMHGMATRNGNASLPGVGAVRALNRRTSLIPDRTVTGE